MEIPPSVPTAARFPRKVTIGLVAGWVVIMAKCAATPYLISRWEVPVDPGWVIVPTLAFATLITVLVLTRNWAQDND